MEEENDQFPQRKLGKAEMMFVISQTNKPSYTELMAQKRYCIKTETMAEIAKALGHPARISIMRFLAKRNTCYFGAIHEELPITKATVSQHLAALKQAGLIQGEIETPKVRYCINRENWDYARELFADFFDTQLCDKEDCCEKP